METALVFVLGLVAGSFLNAFLWRLETDRGMTIFTGRSECVHCHHKLGFWDLIPVLSFVFLNSLCRYCAKKISRQYPLVEISSGLAFLLIYKHSPGIAESVFLAGVFLVTLAIFVYDLKFLIIPDSLVLIGFSWLVLWKVLFFKGEWLNYFLRGSAIFIRLYFRRDFRCWTHFFKKSHGKK